MTYLQIEPMPSDATETGTCLVDPHAMHHEGFSPGDTVELESPSGRQVVARVGEPNEEDHDTGFVRLDEHLRGSLKVAIGETVQVSRADVEALESLTVAPLSDVGGLDRDELAAYIGTSLADRGALVNRNEVYYLTLPGAPGATGFKVIEAAPAAGIVVPDTDVAVEYVFSTWGRTQETTFDDVGGLSAELQNVRELVEFPIRFPDIFRRLGIQPPRGIMLFGPPGTGKTLIARAITNELNASFHYINGPGIVSSGYGQTEEKLREVFTEARETLPSVIFIDEVDAIAPQRDETGAHADLRVVTQLLELMDGLETTEGVVVIGTTNRIEAVEPALRRPGRFDREIYIGIPDNDARREILGIHTRGMVLDEEVGQYLDTIAGRTPGYTGADIMELCREAGINALRRQIGSDWATVDRDDVSLADLTVEPSDFDAALDTVQPSILRGSLTTSATTPWRDLAGLDDAKTRLRNIVERPVRHPATFAAMGIDRAPGVLLVGPPGTGKTSLARAAAEEFEFTLLELDTTDVYSQWLGKSEEAVTHAFRVARRSAPSILLIDNLEGIGGTRSEDAAGDVGTRVTNQVLTELDRLAGVTEVTVIGTTNREDLLDPALISGDRFAERIEFGLPDGNARRDIIGAKLRDVSTNLDDGGIAAVVDRTDGLTGAELATVCRNAKLAALETTDFKASVTLELDHFETALARQMAG